MSCSVIGICGGEEGSSRRFLRSVGRDLDDEVGIQGDGDPVEQGDGRDDASCLEAGQCGLGHPGSGSEFNLGQAERQPPLPDVHRPGSGLR
jgi:hypothetical protein